MKNMKNYMAPAVDVTCLSEEEALLEISGVGGDLGDEITVVGEDKTGLNGESRSFVDDFFN